MDPWCLAYWDETTPNSYLGSWQGSHGSVRKDVSMKPFITYVQREIEVRALKR